MKESDFNTIFRDINTMFGVFELKLCKGVVKDSGEIKLDPLAFSRLQDHQRDALLKVSGSNGFFHKLTDPPVYPNMKTRFNQKRPFDCFFLGGIPAYVVACWYIPRVMKRFDYIEINRFLEEERTSTRKSLTFERSAELAERVIDGKGRDQPLPSPFARQGGLLL